MMGLPGMYFSKVRPSSPDYHRIFAAPVTYDVYLLQRYDRNASRRTTCREGHKGAARISSTIYCQLAIYNATKVCARSSAKRFWIW